MILILFILKITYVINILVQTFFIKYLIHNYTAKVKKVIEINLPEIISDMVTLEQIVSYILNL